MTEESCSNSTVPSRGSLTLFGLVLGISVIVSAALVSRSIERIKLSHQVVTVKGYAEKKIEANLAIWSAAFAVRSPSLVSAYERLEKDLGVVLSYLEDRGISKDQVSIKSVNTVSLYKLDEHGNRTSTIEGYELTQSIEVRSDNVKTIEKLANDSTVLIKKNIGFSSYQPRYLYTELDSLKIDLLAAATKDAKLRAEQMAKAAGNEVGPLKQARQGVFQITPADSTEVSDYGMYDTSSINKSVKAVVTVSFSIR